MTPDPRSGRWLRALAIAAFVACGVVTCARSEPARPIGRRIITIGGAVTETAFALGAGPHVVAVDTSSVFPPEVTRLPQIGYQRTIAAESILALAPDLVVASDEAGPPAALAQLRSAGITVAVIPNALSPEAAATRIEAIGAALDAKPAATELANRVRHDTRAALARCCAAGMPGPMAMLVYARGAGTTMVAGKDTAGAAMLELVGARTPATFAGFKPLSAEALVDAAPDVIVIPSRGLATLGGEAGLLALPGVAATPAGRNRRFVAMDDLLLLGFGPRLAEAIDELARRLAAPAKS